MEAVLERTTKEEQKIAKTSISKVHATSRVVMKNKSSFVKIKIQDKGDFLKIPKKAALLLFDILDKMAQGKSFTLIPSNSEISTQQAADMLNVSRPHLVKLLEEGIIPFKKVGTHRRIELKHLIGYQQKSKENRDKKLDFLVKQAQELNLGY
ncbi:MAG: excisionase family DNA-binding protein [Puia sp.]